MKFKSFLNEKRKRSVVVVDIQPMYKQYINFSLEDFTEFLYTNGDILYFYNGPETVGVDRKEDITEWLSSYSELSYDGADETFYYKLLKQTKWVDKGYGFFRGWMDQGVDESNLKKAIRYMTNKRVYDSRDIEEEEWIENFPELKNVDFDDPIFLPQDIRIDKLKKWSGSYLVGGGRNECLAEVKILMDAFNIRYKTVSKFIYG